MSTRRTAIIIGLAAFAVGGFAFWWGGRDPLWIRHTVGDVAASAFVFSGVGLVWARGRRWQRLTLAAAVAFGVEGIQALEWVGPDSPRWQHLVFGSTFDPLDLVAYATGLLLAGLGERALTRRSRRGSTPATHGVATVNGPPTEDPRCASDRSPATTSPASPPM